MGRGTVVAAIAAGVLAGCVAPAHAARLTMRPSPLPTPPGGTSGQVLAYTAAPGERNHLTAVVVQLPVGGGVPGYSVVLTDLGATITSAAPGCTALLHVAVCAVSPPSGVLLDLGDGADRGLLEGAAHLIGGPGDDVLHVQALQGLGVLNGGTTVEGGPGSDTMTTLPGELSASTVVSYRTHTTGVHVSLDGLRNDGAAGERDLVGDGFRMVSGSPGPDVLRGDDRANVLWGREGADQLFGAGGADQLMGDDGPDVLDPGPGTDVADAHGASFVGDVWLDRLLLRDGERDSGSCDFHLDVAVTDGIDETSGCDRDDGH